MIAGVCGGFAEFFGVDVTLIRVLWLLAVLIHGTGVVAYLICLMLMKQDPDWDKESAASAPSYRPEMVAGIALIILGAAFMLRNITGLDWWLPWHWHHFLHISIKDIWPLILIALGAGIMLRSGKTADLPSVSEQAQGQTRLLRNRRDRMVSGVCGGIAAYSNIDSTVIRIVWVFTSLYISFLAGLVCYILMIVIVPEEQ
jgi:phage shock protein PspC (stress-responsive transcriptional regulator)